MGGVQQCVNGLIFRNSIVKRKRTKQAGDSSTHLKTYAKRDDSGLLLNLHKMRCDRWSVHRAA